MRGLNRHILSLLSIGLLTGCASHTNPYRFIFVEKERKFFTLTNPKEECVISGFDVIPKDPDVQKYNEVKLVYTYKNCNMKQVIIMDDKTRVMWGVPLLVPEKKKGFNH